jgi:hypothetical protein
MRALKYKEEYILAKIVGLGLIANDSRSDIKNHTAMSLEKAA